MAEAAGGTAAALPAQGEFKDPTTLLRWVTGLTIACTIAAALALVFRGLEYRFLARVASGELSGDAVGPAAQRSDLMVEGTSGIRALIYLATCIPFGMWIYRANRNARALGAVGMKYSPAGSVGWYFVPFANLVVPFQAMREIWRASANPGNPEAAPGTPLLGWWWALWLGNGFSSWLGTVMVKNAHGVEMAQHASLVAASQNVLQIALNIVALLLLRRITAQQLMQANLVDVF